MAIRPTVGSPDWSDRHPRGAAKCRAQKLKKGEKDLFFESQAHALEICNGTADGVICPRRTECLRIAMQNRENFGIWGGMTPETRLALRLRYPRMPERWTWRADCERETERTTWPKAS